MAWSMPCVTQKLSGSSSMLHWYGVRGGVAFKAAARPIAPEHLPALAKYGHHGMWNVVPCQTGNFLVTNLIKLDIQVE